LLKFDNDGSYNSILLRAQFEDRFGDCIDTKISELITKGKAKNAIVSKTKEESTTDSMISGYPDAILCSSTERLSAVFYLSKADNDYLYYVQMRFDMIKNMLTFNRDANGTYSANTRNHYVGCIKKSLDQLYKDGKAFNLAIRKITKVEGLNTSAQIYNDWPTVIN